MTDLRGKDIDNSPLWRHCVEEHRGRVQEFSMSVSRTFRNDTMLRQITEAVQINNTDQNILMNSRAEWRMARVPYATISEY